MKKVLSEDEVIAAIHDGDRWEYYAGEPDIWVMDWNKWHQAYVSHGYNALEPDPEERFGILVVDDSTAEAFLKAISPNRLDEDWLRDQLRGFSPHWRWDEMAHLFPQLLIDFDAKKLYSINAEGINFDLYVPEGWEGISGDFYDLIPENRRYWIDGSVDYLDECRKHYKSYYPQ